MAETAQRIETRRAPAYGEDYAAWVEHQLVLLRARRVEELDYENLIDEVGDLGSNVYDKIVSAVEIVLLHMLKWDFQPGRRSRSWQGSILEHRRRIEREMRRNPSFHSRIEEAVGDAYPAAQAAAVKETELPLRTFPETCPYDWTAITSREHPLPGDDA